MPVVLLSAQKDDGNAAVAPGIIRVPGQLPVFRESLPAELREGSEFLAGDKSEDLSLLLELQKGSSGVPPDAAAHAMGTIAVDQLDLPVTGGPGIFPVR